METSMIDLLEKILETIRYIAVGGTIAIVFFFIFAQSIVGSRTIHKQLENMEKELDKVKKELKNLSGRGRKDD